MDTVGTTWGGILFVVVLALYIGQEATLASSMSSLGSLCDVVLDFCSPTLLH